MAPDSYYQLTSERFNFRKVIASDVHLWLPFFEDNPNLHFLGIDIDTTEELLAKEWVERQLDRYNRGGFGHLAVISKVTSELVGMSGIIQRVVGGHDALEIAYSVMPEHWGKGYATEMAQTLLKFGQENKIAEQFISMIHPENFASIKVAEKNGMVYLKNEIFSSIPVHIFGTHSTN